MFLFPHLHTRFPNKPYSYRVLCSVLFCVVSACRAWLHSGGGGGGGGGGPAITVTITFLSRFLCCCSHLQSGPARVYALSPAMPKGYAGWLHV